MEKKKKTKRVALYLRVSTKEQTTDNQRHELEQVAERAGWDIVAVFEDAGISGANGREKRPGLDDMLRAAGRREFDMVASWSVDRLGRSLKHLVAFLEELRALKVDLYLHTQGIDTSTPAGAMMFNMLGVFAEFERTMIVERVNAGIKRAKAKGVKMGRRKFPPIVVQDILERQARGDSVRHTAKDTGISTFTVQRIRTGLH